VDTAVVSEDSGSPDHLALTVLHVPCSQAGKSVHALTARSSTEGVEHQTALDEIKLLKTKVSFEEGTTSKVLKDVYLKAKGFKGRLPESQGQNLALTVLCVPCSLDSGRSMRSA